MHELAGLAAICGKDKTVAGIRGEGKTKAYGCLDNCRQVKSAIG